MTNKTINPSRITCGHCGYERDEIEHYLHLSRCAPRLRRLGHWQNIRDILNEAKEIPISHGSSDIVKVAVFNPDQQRLLSKIIDGIQDIVDGGKG